MNEIIDNALSMGYEIREKPFKYLHKPVTNYWGLGIVYSPNNKYLPKNKSDFVDIVAIPNNSNNVTPDNIRILEDYTDFSEALIEESDFMEIIKKRLFIDE